MEGSRSIALHAAWAVDALPGRRRAGRGVGRQGLLRPGRPLGVRDGHPGARRHRQHLGVPGPRLPAPRAALDRRARRRRAQPRAGAGARTASEATMDFADSPDEAAFRLRLRAWLARQQPGPAAVVDGGRVLGRRRRPGTRRSTTPASSVCPGRPRSAGTACPSVYDVILDEELIAAGAPPRPSVGYLVQGLLEHGNEDVQQRFLPGLVSGRDRWCQGFSEPDAGSDLASLRTRAVRDGDEYVITGHKVWTSYSDAGRLVSRPGPHRSRRAQAPGHLRLRRADAPARHRAAAAADDQRHHARVRRGALRRRPGRRRQHDRRARRGLAPGHDDRQPRARAGRARLRRPLRQARQRAGATS